MGIPDKWGAKIDFFGLPILVTLMFWGYIRLEKKRKTSAEKVTISGLMGNLIFIFWYIQVQSYRVALHLTDGLGKGFLFFVVFSFLAAYANKTE